MVASRLTKQRKGSREKQGSHMTSSRHRTMHMTLQDPARQHTHTRTASHATDTHSRTQTHTLCKTKYKHRLTLTKTSAFDISQNPRILAVPKPKRHLWQKCLIFMLIMLFPKHLTAVGPYCGECGWHRLIWQHTR